MIFAIGAGDRVVAVSSYDSFPPEVRKLPNVGALLDPDVERILSLRPDLVVVNAIQDDLRRQLARAGIATFDYRHGGLDAITATIRGLGATLGEERAAGILASRIERGLDAIRDRVRGRPRPRTLLVFGRERLSLRGIYATGGTGFLHDMLTAAGGDNVFADVKAESVQASTEQIISRRPDVIIEVRAMNEAFPAGDRAAEARVWTALGSVPAVRNGRISFLFDDRIVIPGPRIVDGTRELARMLHPEAFE
jgi:iron complex transport system substrate-binding protein